jgi:hypothetical protein
MSLTRRDLVVSAAATLPAAGADWNTAIHGGFELTSTSEIVRVKEFVRATEGDKTVFERHWDHSIRRDLI